MGFKFGLRIILGLGLLCSLGGQSIKAQTACDVAVLSARVQSLSLQGGYDFYISSDAQLPTFNFAVEYGGELTAEEKECLNSSFVDTFDWQLSIQYWDGITAGAHKVLPWKLGAQRSGLATGDGWQYEALNRSSNLTVTPAELGDRFGGGADGLVKATMRLGDRTLTASAPVRLWADPVDKTEIKAYLGDLKYQLLGYLESKFIHIYHGVPLLNCGNMDCSESDGGYGLMQLTDCSGATGTLTYLPTKVGGGHGFPSYRQLWDWKANADGGKSCYEIKIAYLCSNLPVGSDAQLHCGYSAYNGSRSYGDLGITVLNEMRQGRFRAGWF